MKLKLQVVLIPVTLAEMPTSSIATFKKFLHLTDPESSVGQVCDALIKRYNRLYPEADKLQVEGIQDDDRCDLDPDFAASDVFQSGDVVRVLVDNLLPTYSRDTSMILPDVTTATADATTSSKRRADSSEANESRMLKKSRTIWGIRQDSPSEAAETASKAVPTNDLVTKSPVLLPPPSHQTPGSKIIPQKKPSPASSSGRRITSGMLKLPDESENSTESVKKTPQAVSQSPEHDEIDDGTDSDDLVSHRLLKHRKENDKHQATKLAPPPTVPTKTPSKKEPLNTLTPYHNSTQPPQPQPNVSQAPPITQIHQQQHFQPPPQALQQAPRQQFPINSPATNNNGWQPTQTRLPQPQFPELQRPKQVGSQMKLMHTYRQGTVPTSQFGAAPAPHQHGHLPHMQHSAPPHHQNQTLQSPYAGTLNISHPSLTPQYLSPSGSFQSHLSPAPGPQPQLPVQRPSLSSSPAAPVQNTTQHQQHRNTSLLENSLIRQYPVTSPIEDQKMQESIKQLIHEKVDDAMRRQEYLVKQGVGKIREEEEKEKERKTAEDRRRDEEQRRMQEEMRKAEENRILMPAEELKRQAELLEQEQEWRDRTLLFQKHLQQKEELLKKKEALRQQEVRKEAILRKQDDLRRQAELKKLVERKQEEALRQQEQTKAKVLQEKSSSQGKGAGENSANKSQAQGKAPPVHVFDYDKNLPSNVMKPATGFGGLTPTVAALPQPEPRVNNTNGSATTKDGSSANKEASHSEKVAHDGNKEDVSLNKGEIMSIIRNNMRVPHKIIKKLSVPTPDNAKFAAHEEERKRQIREENIARNAAELESRRRNAAAAPSNTTRSLRSRVTIGGVPNFDTNLDNIEDEKDKEKEKLKETRANALPAPFNDFASKSKLSSIYVKMKKLDARIEKQHQELLKKIKSEPSTPNLQRTEDASQKSDDTPSGQQSTLQKLQAAAEDESDEDNDASEKEGSPEEKEDEEAETNASSQSSEDDVEMQDAAAVSNSSEEDASVNESDDSEDEESEDVDSDAVRQPKKKIPEQTKPTAVKFNNQTSSSTPGIVKRGRGRPRKDDPRNLTKKVPQPRASLRTRSAAPEVIELESSSENSDEEDIDDNAEQIEDDKVTTEESNQVSVATSAFEISESEKPLNAPEQTTRESSEAISGYDSQRSESHYTDAEASDVRGREINDDANKRDGEAASDPIEIDSKAGTEAPESHGDKLKSSNEDNAKEAGLASSLVEDKPNVTQVSSHATTATSSSPPVAADPLSSKLSQANEDAKKDDSVEATSPKKASPVKASKEVAPIQSAPASQKTDASPTKKVTASMLVAALNKLPKSREGQKVGSNTPVSKHISNTSKRASHGEGLSPIKKPRLEPSKVDAKVEDGEKDVKPDVVISSNSESESSSSSSSSSSSESESSSESSSESDSDNESSGNASQTESTSQKAAIVTTQKSDGNDIVEKTDEKSHLSNLKDTGSEKALVSKENSTSKEEATKTETIAEKKSVSGKGQIIDKKPAASKEKKPVASNAASSSSSNSSSDSDSDSSESQSLSESESEPKKKPPTIAKSALKKVPSLVSSRVVKKNFGSLAKPTAKPIKAPSPPVHKLSEGVRTITVETPFSKSSDEDEKAKANKAQQRPAPTATLPKLNSLSDLQKRGVPDVRDSKDKSSSDSKKQPEKKLDISESELESLSDSDLSSDSDSGLDSDSSDDEDSSKFASLKKLSGDRDAKKKKKKKSLGFSSLMRDANKK